MKKVRFVASAALACLLMAASFSALAQFKKNEPAPSIVAKDIFGKAVNIDEIIEKGRDLVILFFFTPDTGEDVALALHDLDLEYGGESLEVIALGWKEDEEELRKFAQKMQIRYFIISDKQLQNADWAEKVNVLPMTLFVVSDKARTIERVVSGGGQSKAKLLNYVAESYFQQRKTDKAKSIADQAIEAGANEARELRGYILTEEGKLDEAEKEFGQVGSKAGLAKVALTRGDLDGAVAIASGASDAYAKAIKSEALFRSGKLDEAAKEIGAIEMTGAPDWQQSDALNSKGRIAQAQGDIEVALANYDASVAFDPYNIEPLSNEAAAHRDQGNLEAAQEVLQQASSRRDDPMVAMMLKQVQQELEEQNNLERRKLIQSQIEDLSARFEELKESGELEERDNWSTRPAVLALLPGDRQSPVFFDRAGTDVVLQRELEARLQESDRVSVVERMMLDSLLQELQLGSSDLTNPDTQRRLGEVLSASMLGFIEYAQLGSEIRMYLRLIDTETTEIAYQGRHTVNEGALDQVVEEALSGVLAEVDNSDELKGLVAEVMDEDTVLINLGGKHGVAAGQKFNVLVDGTPIEVGGRVIAYRQKPVGQIEVTSVEDDYAEAKVTKRRDGAVIQKEMKLKAAD